MYPHYNNFNLQGSNSTSAVPTLPYSTQFPSAVIQQPQPPPPLQQPDPYVTANAIYFTLPPNTDVMFNFSMERGIGQHVHLLSRSGQIPFILNGTQFIGGEIPVDVTAATARGENHIKFLSQGRLITAFAELHLGAPVDIEGLVRRVLSEFPALPPSQADPFASRICPLSHRPIENAAKGEHCTHAQCFDLKTYIENGVETGLWACPVCHVPLPYEALRIDPSYLAENRIVSEMPINSGNMNMNPSESGAATEKPLEEKDLFADFIDDWKGNNDWDFF